MKHDYITITNTDKSSGTGLRPIPGIIAICSVCGQVAEFYTDGQIRVIIIGKLKMHDRE